MHTTLVFVSNPLSRRLHKGVQAFRQRLLEFLFPAESDRWLTVLRTGLGLQVVLYCTSLRNDWIPLFAGNGNGLISRDLAEAILSVESPLIPRLGWLVTIGDQLGFRDVTTLWMAWTCLACAGCCLLLGLCCRTSAVVAWFLHLCAVKSGALLSYGMDNFTTIGLFYLMVSPLPDQYSLDWKIRKHRINDSHPSGFFRRVLQLHMCIIYFFGGITKCMGSGWWNGTSIWRALIRAPFNVVPPDILVSWRYFFPVFGISVCLLETGYPFFIWMKRTQRVWLACVIGMHITIGLAMGLYLFTLIMIILNVAAFGVRGGVHYDKDPPRSMSFCRGISKI